MNAFEMGQRAGQLEKQAGMASAVGAPPAPTGGGGFGSIGGMGKSIGQGAASMMNGPALSSPGVAEGISGKMGDVSTAGGALPTFGRGLGRMAARGMEGVRGIPAPTTRVEQPPVPQPAPTQGIGAVMGKFQNAAPPAQRMGIAPQQMTPDMRQLMQQMARPPQNLR